MYIQTCALCPCVCPARSCHQPPLAFYGAEDLREDEIQDLGGFLCGLDLAGENTGKSRR